MSDESLSQNQVESLLRAMEGFEGDSSAAESSSAAGRSPQDGESASSRAAGGPVAAYDFKRPERVGKDQMRAMQSLHEAIARNFGASMSGMLQTMVEVKMLSVDQLTYSEFVFSLDNPSCFNVIRPEPLDGHWMLDIAPGLSYAIIDRMLGGDPAPDQVIRRPLTEIENRLIHRVVVLFLQQLRASWETIVELEFEVDSTESNPQLVQIVPPNEVVILVAFEIMLGKNRGRMNLCIPFNTVEKYNSRLSRNNWVGYGRATPTDLSRGKISSHVDAAPVDVVVTLARSAIRTGDLLELAVGDIIATEQPVSSQLEFAIQDVPKFHARPGAYKGKKAVQIDSVIEKPIDPKLQAMLAAGEADELASVAAADKPGDSPAEADGPVKADGAAEEAGSNENASA